MSETCQVARCRRPAAVFYLERGVCELHWNEFSAEDAPADALRMALGIEPVATAEREEPMAKRKTTTKTRTPAKKAATKKPAKPKKARPPKDDLCVFALRMTEAERTKLHTTAGPREAARLARAVLVAAANEDTTAFQSALKQAAKLRI